MHMKVSKGREMHAARLAADAPKSIRPIRTRTQPAGPGIIITPTAQGRDAHAINLYIAHSNTNSSEVKHGVCSYPAL